MMEEVSLQLKLISCRDLQAFNFFQKLSVYAVVSIYNDNDEQNKKRKKKQQQCLPRQKTLVDEEGGGNPEWNHMMQFDLKPISADHLFLRFKLQCAGLIFGKRCIGEVCVPFKDLIDEFNGTVRFVSYQIRSSDGKPNGVLNFSYEVKGKSENKGDDLASTTTNTNHFIPEKEKVEVQSPEKRSLYPSLDEIRSPLPAFTVGRGVYYHPCPCPSPLLQSPGPYWYPAETAAGYGYGLRG